MRDFLTDFYNKVINFFQAEKVEGENTKETAKNRLKLVLMQDRSNLEPEVMAQLREELIEVISKYIVIDKEALGLNLDGDGESMALMLNIPVIRAKKPEEIQEALEEAKKAKELAQKGEESELNEQESEPTSEESEEVEETIIEFSEGAIDEIEPPCDEQCSCGCQQENSCTCMEDVSIEVDKNEEDEVNSEVQPEDNIEKLDGEAESQKKNSSSKVNKKGSK